jgi:hypothetical protein
MKDDDCQLSLQFTPWQLNLVQSRPKNQSVGYGCTTPADASRKIVYQSVHYTILQDGRRKYFGREGVLQKALVFLEACRRPQN